MAESTATLTRWELRLLQWCGLVGPRQGNRCLGVGLWLSVVSGWCGGAVARGSVIAVKVGALQPVNLALFTLILQVLVTDRTGCSLRPLKPVVVVVFRLGKVAWTLWYKQELAF